MNYFHDVLLSKIQLISFLLLRVSGKNGRIKKAVFIFLLYKYRFQMFVLLSKFIPCIVPNSICSSNRNHPY